MPPRTTLALPMFLNNHRYLKLFSFSLLFNNLAPFQFSSVFSLFASHRQSPAQRRVFTGRLPVAERESSASALARRAAALGGPNQPGSGKARRKDHSPTLWHRRLSPVEV